MELPIKYSETHYTIRKKARLEYIKLQEGLCYYCHEPLKKKAPLRIRKMKLKRGGFPRGFWKYPIHLHHCHKTDLTLGAVHNYCNAVLWQYHGE